jgi:hypothetical protein
VDQKNEVPSKENENPSSDAFATRYPNISDFVMDGWVQIGRDEYSRTFIRAVDQGGMVWEGKTRYATMDAALDALEAGIAAWFDETSTAPRK